MDIDSGVIEKLTYKIQDYLSYDIIKAHSGELKVETMEGEGAGFIIQLPSTGQASNVKQ